MFSQGGSSLCQDCRPHHTVWSHHVTNCKSTALYGGTAPLYAPITPHGRVSETLKGCVRVLGPWYGHQKQTFPI